MQGTRGERSFPVIPLRSEICAPGDRLTVPFARRTTLRALDAASAHGRLAVVSRQLDPDDEHPECRGLEEVGHLVEIGEVVRESGRVQVCLDILRSVRLIRTDFVKPHLQLYVIFESEAEAIRRPNIDWLPEPLWGLHDFLRHELRFELVQARDPRNTELTLQHQASDAIGRWLDHQGIRAHYRVSDNRHMPLDGKFSDVLIEHASGHVALEVKKNDQLQPLLADVRKLKSYMRGAGLVKLGVLVFPTDRELPTELLRRFTDDRRLVLVACAKR